MEIVRSEEARIDLWQFRLTSAAAGTSSAGASNGVGLRLEVGQGLPTCPVVTPSGRSLGLLIGHAIDIAAGRLIRDRHEIAADPGEDDHDAVAEGLLAGLAGNFLLLYLVGGVARLYPDGVAHLPCVYDATERAAGTTAHALLDDDVYEARFNAEAYRRMEVDDEGWFPAGLTAHEGIRRLLPNHYLDLHTWRSARFWPRGEIEEAQAPEETADCIAAIVRAQISALVGSDKAVAQGLTAGFETRWLLACARPHVDKIEFVTVAQQQKGHIDTDLAAQLARRFDLSYRVLERRVATAAQRDIYVRRGGHCIAGGNSLTHPSVLPLADTHYFVSGQDGAIGRGYNWVASDRADTVLGPDVLAGRLGMPQTEGSRAAFRAWCDGLPIRNALHILDLNYTENRGAPWCHSQFCCDPSVMRFNPIGTQETVRLMLTLPETWRREYRLASHIIDRNWPELLQLPINTRGRVRDIADKVALAFRDPGRVVRKLRKLAS